MFRRLAEFPNHKASGGLFNKMKIGNRNLNNWLWHRIKVNFNFKTFKNFKKKSRENISIHSPPFYYFGYKFSLGLYPNRCNPEEDTHLSSFRKLFRKYKKHKAGYPLQRVYQFKEYEGLLLISKQI